MLQDKHVEDADGNERQNFAPGRHEEHCTRRRGHSQRVDVLHQTADREVRDPLEHHGDGEDLQRER